MEKQVSKKPTPKQRQNMQFSEDRFELLEIIHEMISDELERRGIANTNNADDTKKSCLSIIEQSPRSSLKDTMCEKLISLLLSRHPQK